MEQIPSEAAVVLFQMSKLFPMKYFATKVAVFFDGSKLYSTKLNFKVQVWKNYSQIFDQIKWVDAKTIWS